jgi:hypothetical protein
LGGSAAAAARASSASTARAGSCSTGGAATAAAGSQDVAVLANREAGHKRVVADATGDVAIGAGCYQAGRYTGHVNDATIAICNRS